MKQTISIAAIIRELKDEIREFRFELTDFKMRLDVIEELQERLDTCEETLRNVSRRSDLAVNEEVENLIDVNPLIRGDIE